MSDYFSFNLFFLLFLTCFPIFFLIKAFKVNKTKTFFFSLKSGFVECQWKIDIFNCKKVEEGAFFINYSDELLSPGNSLHIDIFFKPKKPVNNETIFLQ